MITVRDKISIRTYKDPAPSSHYRKPNINWRTTNWTEKISSRPISKIVYIKRHLNLTVGIYNYEIHVDLSHIVEQIEEAKELLQYEANWDENGSQATDEVTFLKAVGFIIKYSTAIFKNSGVIIKSPYIDLLPDGSVYVQWETDKGELLIIFKKGEHPNSYFYAKKKNSGIPYKSYVINEDKHIDDMLFYWMKNYLS